LVRRLTTRGFDRPLGLVSLPLAAASTNVSHHVWKSSGGNGAAGGELAADQCQAVFEAERIRCLLA